MFVNELFEDAQSDLSHVGMAQKWAYDFIDWVDGRNKRTPLEDIGLSYRTFKLSSGNMEALYLPAWKLDLLPHDLNLGIGWMTDGSHGPRGQLLHTIEENNRKYYAVMVAPHDPRKDTDVVWSLNTSSLVHEITHYFDYKRGYDHALYRQQQYDAKRERITGKRVERKSLASQGPAKYYNDPLEYNAHFHQALAEIFSHLASNIASKKHYGEASEIKYLRSFVAFQEKYDDIMSRQKYNYTEFLTKENKRKIVLRLYKIYELIKKNFPDIPEMQQQADAFVDRWKQQDQASS